MLVLRNIFEIMGVLAGVITLMVSMGPEATGLKSDPWDLDDK